MVKLHSISLTNFMNIEQLDLEFDDKTTVMIGGDIGEGKSTLVFALALALVGYRKGDSYRDYVKRGAGEARVSLYADLFGYPIYYDIHIYNREYGQPMEKTIRYRDKVYGNSECKLLMDELDVEYLEHVMFLYQNDSSIVDLKPAERAKLLKKLFHFEFEDQVTLLKRKLDDEQLQMHDASIRYEEANKRAFNIVKLLPSVSNEDLEDWKISLANKRKELSSLEQFNEVFVKTFEKELKEAEGNYIGRKSWYDKSSLQIQKKESEIETAKIEFANLVINCIDDNSEQLEQDLSSLKKEKDDKKQQLAVTIHSLDVLEKQLAVASTGVCHACGHEVDENHVNSLQQTCDETLNKKRELESKLTAINVRINEINANLKAIEDYYTAYEKKTSLGGQIEFLSSQLDDLRVAFQESENALTFAKNKLDELENKASQIQSIKEGLQRRKSTESEILRLEARLEEALHNNSINEERVKTNMEIEHLREEHSALLSSLSTQYNNHSLQTDVLKKSLAVFETDFPNYIILKTCAQLESYINGFIQKVFPYMRVKLKPSRSGVEFYYVSQSAEDDWLSVKMASGSQSAILSLAWRVALAKLYGVSTIILDEADASTPEDTAQIIYQFISELDTFDQIIFISHKRQAMKELSSLIDNVVCYYVQDGEYTVIENT